MSRLIIKLIEKMKKKESVIKNGGELSYKELTPKDYGYNKALDDVIKLLKT